jgi:hypothetical protein
MLLNGEAIGRNHLPNDGTILDQMAEASSSQELNHRSKVTHTWFPSASNASGKKGNALR